ncbi:MAG: hypothetical protein A3B73_05275 [Omnitrophica WOR_2 bacterium RIFCSPHIGHO2_02_FULL_63_39]|nr:MAG: hypothetical protein A3E56_01710 [Omnitrophica WOR_2 bacterium RIFCSPHIGHO2_12_FULL_64_13]OGX36573.1 MAG: hypothetical protein A3B73_05275 [Omnitrophica WOR_2 bacterium RIFCSPHIGHO2_02_FULL_63_39]OGX47319.1 MAG: hypothetical protein A3G88_03670 [Omnitrophica WOR_2 bacterium RIFCSPLOWO2_12_FULL_63_16]
MLRSKSVDLLEVQAGRKGLSLSRAVSVPIPDHGDAQVVGAIKTALSQLGQVPERLGVCVSAQEILLRSFLMPLVPKSEWEDSIRFEARKYIPFKTEDLTWNFHVIEDRAHKQMRVTFLGLRTQTFSRIRQWLVEAGVTPAFLEAQSVSLARVMAGPSANARASLAGQFVGLVDVDLAANAAHIVVAKDQVPYFARDVNLSLDPEGPGVASPGIDPRAKVLLGELRLSLDFFSRETPGAVAGHLFLYGEEAAIGPWASWLAEQLRCSVSVGALDVLDQRGHGLSAPFACAVGLALRAREPHPVTLDLREGAAGAGRTSERLATVQGLMQQLQTLREPAFLEGVGRAARAQAVLAAIAVAALGMLGYQRIAHAKAEYLKAAQTAPDVGWGLRQKGRAELDALQQQLQQRLERLRALTEHRLIVTEKLDALTRRLPDGVWLDGLVFQRRGEAAGAPQTSLRLMGGCFQPEQRNELEVIGRLASNLKEDPAFFKGFHAGQLGEITIRETDKQTTYRTFTLTYNSESPR